MDSKSMFPKLSGMVGRGLENVLGGQKTSKNLFFCLRVAHSAVRGQILTSAGISRISLVLVLSLGPGSPETFSGQVDMLLGGRGPILKIFTE